MRPGAAAIGVAILVAGFATTIELRPFVASLHGYRVDLPVGFAAAFLAATCVMGARVIRSHERFAALSAAGGAVLAGSILYADIVAGPPLRIPAAPGQAFAAPHTPGIEVLFPGLRGAERRLARWPESVTVRDGGRIRQLAPDETLRAGTFAFTAVTWPIAYVRAHDTIGHPVTATQPNGAAFLSPYLTFPDVDADGRPVDFFSVPPLHRDIGVKYFQGLPERGINVPFLVLQIRESNGSKLFEGVAVDGRQIAKAGVRLTFSLGTYPSVIMTGAPPLWIFGAGLSLVLAGFAGYAASALRPSDARSGT